MYEREKLKVIADILGNYIKSGEEYLFYCKKCVIKIPDVAAWPRGVLSRQAMIADSGNSLGLSFVDIVL